MDSDTAPELYTIWGEAKTHIEQGDYDKAIEIYKYILIRYSDNEIAVEYANAYLGDIYLTLRQLDSAENHIKKAISYKPENPAYHYLLGFTYSIKCQWDKAIGEFEAALGKEPNNGEYLRGLGWAIYSNGDKMRGLACLHKAIELAPTNVNILTDMAAAYLTMANISKAKELAERAVKIEPQNALAQQILKTTHSFQKESEHHWDKPMVEASRKSISGSNVTSIYQFKVSLKEMPNIWRIIEIKENQMLSSLHKAIFNAFDRFDEHLYSFFMSNKPYDKDSEYTLPDPDGHEVGKYANRVRINTLHLQPSQKFLYLFDYGDEWWHEVELIGLRDEVPLRKYPRVTKKHGKSPSQYTDERER
jgi:tetratricopeptide (TPR) repeat protein